MGGCDEPSSASTSAANVGFRVVSELLLLTVWVPFAVYFMHHMIKKEQDNPLTLSVLCFAVSALTAVLTAFWWDIIEPMRQTRYAFSLGGCITLEFLTWSTNLTTYVVLIHVMLRRLQFAFEDTVFEASQMTILTNCAVNALNWLAVIILTIALCAGINCSVSVQTGLMHDFGLARRRFRVCDVRELSVCSIFYIHPFIHGLYLSQLFNVFGSLLCGVCVFVCMFVYRRQ